MTKQLIPIICPICREVLYDPPSRIREAHFPHKYINKTVLKKVDNHMRTHNFILDTDMGWEITPCFLRYVTYIPPSHEEILSIQRMTPHTNRPGDLFSAEHMTAIIRYAKCGYRPSFEKHPDFASFFKYMDRESSPLFKELNDEDTTIYKKWLQEPTKPIKEIAKESGCTIKRAQYIIATTHITMENGLLEDAVEDALKKRKPS